MAVSDITDAEQSPLRAHVASGCPRCAGRLAEAQSVYEQIGLSLPPITPQDSVKSRLMDKVRATPANAAAAAAPSAVVAPVAAASSTAAATPYKLPPAGVDGAARARAPAAAPRATAPVGRMWFYVPMISSAALLLISAMLFYGYFNAYGNYRRARKNQRQHNRQLAMQAAAWQKKYQAAKAGWQSKFAAENASLKRVQSQMRLLTTPHLKLAALHVPKGPAAMHATMLYNSAQHVCFFSAKGMKAPPAGKIYEVWLITKKQVKIRAGIFGVGPGGTVNMMAHVPANIHDISLTAVTIEPAGGVAQPTGAIQLLGKVLKMPNGV